MAKYIEILSLYRPLSVGKDDNERSVWVCDYSARVAGYAAQYSDEIAYYLEAVAGVLVAADVYIGSVVDIPVEGNGPFYHFEEVGGLRPDETSNNDVYDLPTLKIATYHKDYDLARTNSLNVYSNLHGVRGVTITLP